MKTPLIAVSADTDTDEFGLPRLFCSRAYCDAVSVAGGLPLIAGSTSPEEIRKLLSAADGLLLTGGSDLDPSLYGQTAEKACGKINSWFDLHQMRLADAFLSAGKPVLGICRGMQVLNVILGGTLWQDLPSGCGFPHTQGSSHTVSSVPGSFCEKLFGPEFTVNSYHHQAVRDLADSLTACAFSENGVLVEAFRHKLLPVFGVQWHPEMLCGAASVPCTDMLPLFQHFIRLC